MEWDTDATWRKQMERRLNEIGSMTKGNQAFQADRVSDLVEQIAELRTELQRVAERQDKIAEFIKANVNAEKCEA